MDTKLGHGNSSGFWRLHSVAYCLKQGLFQLFGFLLMLPASGLAAGPATLTVDTLVDENDGDLTVGDISLREAISHVAAGGKVLFSPALAGGTILLTLGQLNITKDLTIEGMGPEHLSVSGNGTFRVFNVDNGSAEILSSVRIEGLTVTRGRASGGNFVGDGAGLFNAERLALSHCVISDNESSNVSGGVFNSGEISIDDCQIVGNRGPFGAGFRNRYGTAKISNSTLAGNEAAQFGGGIDNFGGTLKLLNSVVDDNTAAAGGGIGVGGANGGFVRVVNSTITGNRAAAGAGIINDDRLELLGSRVDRNDGDGIYSDVGTELSISQSTVSWNQGAGISNESASATLVIQDSVISNNETGVIGGPGDLTVVNSTIANNNRRAGAFGIGTDQGVLRLLSVTVSGNGNPDTANGGGIGGLPGELVEVRNTILAGNVAATYPDCQPGVVMSEGSNVFGDPSGCGPLRASDFVGDPGLAGFVDNGAPGNGHFQLQATSPAIDRGDNASCPSADQLGVDRPRGIACDIGAIELAADLRRLDKLAKFELAPRSKRIVKKTRNCPDGYQGTFRFRAALTNVSDQELFGLGLEVSRLTRKNLLWLPPETSLYAEGDRFPVPREGGYADGVLRPRESVDMLFRVCLKRIQPVEFGVSVWGSTDADAGKGRVSYWTFDDHDGSMLRDIVGSNDGTVEGATWTDGIRGSALRFDGLDDWVALPETFLFHQDTDATLAFWMKRGDDRHRSIFWTRGDNADRDRFNIYSGGLVIIGGAGFGFDYREPEGRLHALLEAQVAADEWVHVAVTRSGDRYALYVNGERVTSATDSDSRLPASTGTWYMGRRSGYMYKGLLDEVALYDRALRSNEVRALYRQFAP